MVASKATPPPQTVNTVRQGIAAALPVVLGYIPLGMAAGVLGASVGLSPLEVSLLSILVFAGSAQFVFANLYMGSPLQLITVIFLINFRHFLYSASLTQTIKHLPLPGQILIGSQLTDECFAVASVACRQPPTQVRGLFALNCTSYLAWCGGNISGALLGEWVDSERLGADFLLIAMFAALLMLNITADVQWCKIRRRVAVAVVAAAAMAGLELWHPSPLNILLVATVAAAFGLWIQSRSAKEEGEQA